MPAVGASNPVALRHDWSREEVLALLALPFTELLHQAASVHRQHFDPAEVQVLSLIHISSPRDA